MSCPLCQSDQLSAPGPYRAESALMQNRHRIRCDACDLVFVDPLPSETEWDAYNASYFTSAHGNAHATARAVSFRAALGKIRAGHVSEFLRQSGRDVKSVLEIGPGFGEFAAAWKTLHPETAYAAVETDTHVHAQLRQLDVALHPSLAAAGAGQRRYDLVLASHVLEHTLDPVGFLAAFSRLSSPGGVVFIEVPCQDFRYKRIDEPHTLFFDKPALAEAAERAGLQNLQLSYHGERRRDLIAALDQGRARRMMGRLQNILQPGTGHKNLPGTLSWKERMLARGFRAHVSPNEPARWLRLLALAPNS